MYTIQNTLLNNQEVWAVLSILGGRTPYVHAVFTTEIEATQYVDLLTHMPL